VERGVRFVQIYHNNWDHHSNVSRRLPMQCNDIDQATYGLIEDLKARGSSTARSSSGAVNSDVPSTVKAA
jgi:hypothetical protein